MERSTPVTIDSIIFAHGQNYHDGGWFDASAGKPRLQVKKTAGGRWEDVGTIEGYPATTATDPKGLGQGQQFKQPIPPQAVVGIRVIGVPACGDNPQQSFASCAELQGVPKK